MAASHWRETPRHGAVVVAATGGVEGILPLYGIHPEAAWGRTPREVTCIIFFTYFITLHETHKNL